MLGFATDYAGESTSVAEMRNMLLDIADAGFSHIHWTHEWSGDYIYSVFEMIQIRAWMDEFGLRSKGLHATEGSSRKNVPGKFTHRWTKQDRRDYTSENELNRLAGVELIKNRIDLAGYLGSSEIVLHMQLPYLQFIESEEFKRRYYDQVFKSFDEINYYCRAKRVRVCIENLLGTPNEFQIEQFDKLFERYDPEFLGFCFDTGHANITGDDPFEFLKRYSNRLFSLHLSDNHGIRSEKCWKDAAEMSNSDEHLIPYEGLFDWDRFSELVAESPYELPIVLEVANRDRENRQYLADCLAAGNKITDLILSYRQNPK